MILKDKNILIVGLGLIGGSYAKGLKSKGYKVFGIDIDKETLKYAQENDFIDNKNLTEKELLVQSDIIILSVYPTKIVDFLNENQVYFKKNCLITDTSGVKSSIVNSILGVLREDIDFVFSHPMAGKESKGIYNADPNTFKGANFLITPTDKNKAESIESIKEIARILEFKNIEIVSIEEHDRIISFLSQLTHAIAVSLMNSKENSHFIKYTGDSFRDLTRIAKINENLWSELFLLNKDYLIDDIDIFMLELENLKNKIVNNDTEGLKELFIKATKRRKEFDK
ncbi:MAG: prephenate dehydrogenase [Bacilli bacterium]|nr:prephenate dehydrogenase [Bacilli bacterium]